MRVVIAFMIVAAFLVSVEAAKSKASTVSALNEEEISAMRSALVSELAQVRDVVDLHELAEEATSCGVKHHGVDCRQWRLCCSKATTSFGWGVCFCT